MKIPALGSIIEDNDGQKCVVTRIANGRVYVQYLLGTGWIRL